MGSGKSTLAEKIAKDFSKAYYQTDAIRMEIEIRDIDNERGYGSSNYSLKNGEIVFEQIWKLASNSLKTGHSVLLVLCQIDFWARHQGASPS